MDCKSIEELKPQPVCVDEGYMCVCLSYFIVLRPLCVVG